MTDLLALTLLPLSRWRLIAQQLRDGRSPREILEQHCAELRARDPERPLPEALVVRAAGVLAAARPLGLRPLAWNDPSYPVQLAAIIDPPPVLWVRGAAAPLDGPSVAIVGSRAGSPYALAAAERLAADLARRGIVVVSGLARGVDSAAHRGALSVNRPTLAVLGCGADRVYPGEHDALARSILEQGAIVSELVPGTRPNPQFFPRRNRIISGLSRAVVVIEAGEKSGSLITARCALEQGRDVLAVPGNILNGRNRGGHALLRDGARIVETADDILEELGLTLNRGANGTVRIPGERSGGDFPLQPPDPVLAALSPGEVCDLDQVAERSGLSPSRLLPRLFELELQGLVKRAGGGRFVRC